MLQTNACSPIATNGLKGDIWDNFTSSSYKQLSTVGELTVHHPVSGDEKPFQPLGNGRGYTRPTSLISLWSSAPFLLNNSVGHLEYYDLPKDTHNQSDYETVATDTNNGEQADTLNSATGQKDYQDKGYAGNNNEYYKYPEIYRKAYGGLDPYSPSVASRMAVFNDSINKMLNPDQRRTDTQTHNPVPGYIYRTTAASCIKVPVGYSPIPGAQKLGWLLNWIAPWAFEENGDMKIGPFPEGMPVNLLMNTKIIPDHDEDFGMDHLLKIASLGIDFIGVAKELGGTCTPEELVTPGVKAHAKSVFYNSDLVDSLLGLSKCPDYVVNRGHYFGADLSKEEKESLIAYLKTF